MINIITIIIVLVIIMKALMMIEVLRFTWRKYLGSACTDEFIAEQEKQMKIKTQLEVIKECKRVPRISPPPPEFAELINMCMKVGVMSYISICWRQRL
jgi:hypothetical protein